MLVYITIIHSPNSYILELDAAKHRVLLCIWLILKIQHINTLDMDLRYVK